MTLPTQLFHGKSDPMKLNRKNVSKQKFTIAQMNKNKHCNNSIVKMEINGGKIINALHFYMRKISIKCDFVKKITEWKTLSVKTK